MRQKIAAFKTLKNLKCQKTKMQTPKNYCQVLQIDLSTEKNSFVVVITGGRQGPCLPS